MIYRALLLSAVLITAAYGQVKVLHTVSDFEKALKNSRPTLILFSSAHCGPCRALKPHYYRAALKNTAIDFYLVDTSKKIFKPMLKKHKITGIPTLFGCKDGKIIERESGITSRKELETFMNKIHFSKQTKKKQYK